jgi:hypothetical protein
MCYTHFLNVIVIDLKTSGEPFGKLEWLAAKRKMELEQGLGYKE